MSLATPLSYAYTYKASARGGNYATTQIATETIGNDVYSYTYDKLGNITSISLNGEEIRSFVYDRYNQLKRDNNKIANLTYYYNYDGYGNLTDKRTYEYTTDSLGERLSKTNYIYSGDTAAGWSKLLTEYNGEDITYDAIGNPLTYRGAELTWETRQLKSYDKGNTSVTYKYDADGLRASKTVNGVTTNYQYVSGKLMYENRGGTEIYYSYDSYGAPTSIKYYEPDGTTYTFYLATNQQGDVIGIYNSSGNLAVKYEYDAWGNIISETNASGGTLTGNAAIWNEINPFRYRGYYYDAETGLYYLQSRYYDAETGRFINQDCYISTGTGLLGYNMFAYCDNNPVNFSDPTGEKLFECCPHGDCASCKKKKKKAVYIRRTSSGKDVYISKDSEFQAPSGGIKVIDKRDTNMTDDKHNPAMEIENSFKIVDENLQEDTIDILIQYNNEYPSTHKWTRSKNSLIKEWKGHNVAYRIASAINHEGWKISAQHVGLDEFNDFEFIWEVISPLNSCL